MGENPIYLVDHPNGNIMMVNPCVGAPLAGAFFEEMIARGCNQFIACGGCGVLDRAYKVGHVLIPVEAVRAEGTSYAYLPAGERVFPSVDALAAIKRTLDKQNIPYDEVITWTTDAIYRETADLVRLRKKQGCKVVEMESAAFFAIAKFRGVQFAQLLYGGDSVHESGWDDREWSSRDTIREKLFWLAAESVLGM
jgi:uridine phosphorylase